MIIDCISDLHGFYPELEGGDLLIVAGDLTAAEGADEQLEFISWLQASRYKKKVVIAGNHDNWLEKVKRRDPFLYWGIEYLCDSGTEFEYEEPSCKEWGSREGPLGIVPYEKKKLKIWGSPWTKTFEGINPHCKAFTVDTEDELMDKFNLIPHDIDILITHEAPLGILDKTTKGNSSGSAALFAWLKYVGRPRVHVFGHIHEAYGQVEFFASHGNKMMISVNASYVNERYQPVNKPMRIEL